MIDRRPAMIARCRDAADVRAAVRYAAAAGLPVSVRCGGHNVAGSAVVDGAVMIDMSGLRTVSVDAGTMTAEAGGGCLLRDVDLATTAHGLACPAGIYSYTGLGGLALGGGYGWRCRKWGMTCDHIVGADVVLADGSLVEVSERRHPDLLWALRGGGGGFGVVTRFRLRLHPVGPIVVCCAVYGGGDAVAALASFRAAVASVPDDVHLLASLRRAPGGGSALDVLTVCSADDPAAVQAVGALFASMPASVVTERTMTYRQLQTMVDDSAPAGRRYYTKSGYLNALPDPAIERLVEAAAANPSATGTIDVEYLMGAIVRVTSAESAFPVRDAPFMISAYGSWDDPALDAGGIGWTRSAVAAVAEWGRPGTYLNYVSEEQDPPDTVAIYGGEISARLAAVKRRYDPDDLFRGTRATVREAV